MVGSPRPKTWFGNFFVLVRERKNSRARTKKFPRHFLSAFGSQFGRLSARIFP
ncbi:DUF1661 domain-containing protein [Porphyromonas gingivalis]|nr:DUF1661 domain-containing protein [Porphyromonas gingivalis]MCE8180064.1 DUF1661 domain-containing protein [Porphyromonas gingivalis]